jgi:5'-phosphate synthase pdxT subunit
MRVGVLAIQGDVAEQEYALRAAGAETIRVRDATALRSIQALVVPGGESTTIGQRAHELGLLGPLRDYVSGGGPVWGICAGLILLARDSGRAQPHLGILDVSVTRNAFGRQVDSFETDIVIEGITGGPFRAVFIRAPAISSVGTGVSAIGLLDGQTIVAVRQGNILGTAFHPELTSDLRLHDYFLAMAASPHTTRNVTQAA